MPNEFIIKNGFRSQGNSEITGSLSTFATSSTATLLTLGASGSTSTTLTYTNRVPTLALTSNTNGPSSGGTGPDYLLTLNKVGSDGGPKVGIQISNAGVNSAILAYRAGAPSYLDMGFLIANNQILTLTSAQTVGIGTISPSSKLHVLGTGTTSATTALLVQNANASASLVVNDNGAVAIGQSTPYFFAGNNSLTVNGIVYTSTAGGTSAPALYIGDSGAGAGRGFYGVNQGIGVSTNNATSMYFRGSPNLGSSNYPRIGINVDPTSVLDIRSDFTSSNLLNVSSSIGTVMFISGSGNIGMGTSTPSKTLEVYKGGLVDGNVEGIRITGQHASATAQVALEFYHTYGLISRISTDIGNGGLFPSMYFIHNGITAMKIANTGNVQIGTTTDAGFRLDVNGTARFVNDVNFNASARFGDGTARITGAQIGGQGANNAVNFYFNNGSTWVDDTNVSAFSIRYNQGIRIPNTSRYPLTLGSDTKAVASAQLEMVSTTQGFLPPRMTLAQRTAISTPASGLIVYETGSSTTEGIWVNETTGWQQLLTNTGLQSITGSLAITSSAGTGSAIYAYKSGSTVLDIQGSQGQLFSVVDALSGSLMSVNDVSGLPILEVFSDDRVVMGTYGAPALIVTGSNTVISGSLRGRVVTLSTASATASMDCSLSNFFDLTLSGSMYLSVSNIQPGETINLRITQPATSGSLNYTSSIKFPNGLPYSASATSSVVDLISFISFDSSTLYATSLKNLV